MKDGRTQNAYPVNTHRPTSVGGHPSHRKRATGAAIRCRFRLGPSQNFNIGLRNAPPADLSIKSCHTGRLHHQIAHDNYRLDYHSTIEISQHDPQRKARAVTASTPPQVRTCQRQYCPAECTDAKKGPLFGKPSPDMISTSHFERQDLTLRMGMRRLTRLTNGFSKKLQNHLPMFSVCFVRYNFVRIHKSLKYTTALPAGVSATKHDMT